MMPAFDDTAPYIWAAYGLSALVLGTLVAIIILRARAARRRLARLQAEERDAGA